MGTLKFGDAVSKGWTLFKAHMGPAIIGYLLVVLVSSITCCLLAGPLICSYFILLNKWIKQEQPEPGVGEVFDAFNLFLPSFLLILVLNIGCLILQTVLMFIPILGWLLSVLFGLIFGPVLMWSLMLVANRGMKPFDACGLVIKSILNGSFTTPILLGILAGIIGGAGMLVCCIGIIFTMPIAFCIYAAAFDQVFGSEPSPAPAAETVAE